MGVGGYYAKGAARVVGALTWLKEVELDGLANLRAGMHVEEWVRARGEARRGRRRRRRREELVVVGRTRRELHPAHWAIRIARDEVEVDPAVAGLGEGG